MIDNQPVLEACRLILKNKEQPALQYCVNYAHECKFMCLAAAEDKDIKYQVNYILGNMTNWRGDDARKARQLLKDYVKSVK